MSSQQGLERTRQNSLNFPRHVRLTAITRYAVAIQYGTRTVWLRGSGMRVLRREGTTKLDDGINPRQNPQVIGAV